MKEIIKEYVIIVDAMAMIVIIVIRKQRQKGEGPKKSKNVKEYTVKILETTLCENKDESPCRDLKLLLDPFFPKVVRRSQCIQKNPAQVRPVVPNRPTDGGVVVEKLNNLGFSGHGERFGLKEER